MPDLTKTCRVTGKSFVVTEWEQEHLKKFDMPAPTLCIDERHRRRLAQRNERKIYKGKCDLTGDPMISLYSPDKEFTVYSQDAWWGDDWDGKDYGRDYDFSRPFFDQFQELRLVVPRLSLMNTNAENSEYCNITIGNKNCYLVFGGDYNEDTMYSVFCFKSRDLCDVYWVTESELVFDSVDCDRSYRLKYSQNSDSCRDSAFLYECRRCENCIGCVGLRDKKYHIFNKPYSKEDYERKLREFRLDTWSGAERMKKEFAEFKLQFPVRFAHIINSENVTGDRLRNVKNCSNCYAIDGPAEDNKDVIVAGWGMKDGMSCSMVGHKAELFYEMLGSIGGSRCAFSVFSWHSNDIYYSDMIVNNSHDCFGCTNLKRAEYCILNKQYSKDEYFDMRARIVEHMKSTGEWGEYFPMSHSLFAYNETAANDYFPQTKEEILAEGLKWFDEEQKTPGTGPEIPDSIHDVTDDILNKSLVCEKTGRPYKIIPTELAFYRKMGVPIPRYAPETRNKMRFGQRNPIRAWDRQCAKCGAAINTSYAPDRPEIVYCEECYLASVY